MDGQPRTNWGTLSAYEVPYVVIPDRYLQAHRDDLPGNNVAAVIWYTPPPLPLTSLVGNILKQGSNGNMFYGILGDSDSDHPQVIGEASWLMARTCFPDDGLAGDVGHQEADVTCMSLSLLSKANDVDIVFLGEKAVLPDSAVGERYLTNFGKLRAMGNKLVKKLASNVGSGPSLDGDKDDDEEKDEDEVSTASKTSRVVGLAMLVPFSTIFFLI